MRTEPAPTSTSTSVAMTVSEWSFIWDKLTASYPSNKATPGTFEAWYEELCEYDAHTTGQAIRFLRRTERFMPSLGDVIAAISVIRQDQAEARREQAQQVLQQRRQAQLERSTPRMPEETATALKLYSRAANPDVGPNPEITDRINQLADRLSKRSAPRHDSDDLPVLCTACANSEQPGWYSVTVPPRSPENPYADELVSWYRCQECNATPILSDLRTDKIAAGVDAQRQARSRRSR